MGGERTSYEAVAHELLADPGVSAGRLPEPDRDAVRACAAAADQAKACGAGAA